MPKIEEVGGPNFTTQTGPTPQASVSNAPTVIGDSVANALHSVSTGLKQFQERADVTAAEEASIAFERDKNKLLFDPTDGYFNTQGRAAYDSAGDIDTSLKKLADEYGSGLSANAAKAYRSVVDRHLTTAGADIMRHATTGLKSWELSNNQAQTENTLENASKYYNDDERVKEQLALGTVLASEQADLKGLSGNAKNEFIQTYQGSFAERVIETAIGNSAAEGDAALKKYGDLLEDDGTKLKDKLETKKKAEETKDLASRSVAHGTRIARKHGTDRQAAMEEARNIKDPELRGKVMREVAWQIGQAKQAEVERQTEVFQQGQALRMEGVSPEALEVLMSDGWGELTPLQQQTLQSDQLAKTNWDKFYELTSKPKNELAKINPVDHFHYLHPTQRNALSKAVADAREDAGNVELGITVAGVTKSTVTQLFGAEKDRDAEDIRKADVFYNMLAIEVQEAQDAKGGGELTVNEHREVVNKLKSDFVLKRPWFLPDTRKNLGSFDVEQLEFAAGVLQRGGFDNNAANVELAVSNTDLLKEVEAADMETAVSKIRAGGGVPTLGRVINLLKQAKVD